MPVIESKLVPLRGTSLVAGTWTARQGDKFHAVDPSRGADLPTTFHPATDQDIDAAARSAEEAFADLRARAPEERAKLLEAIADGIAALGDDLTRMVEAETGLARPRIAFERERTTNTLRMFASEVRDGSWVDAAIDHGSLTRRPVAKPDVRSMFRPLGPVVVFGASNFPLAYSTAGGDTASAFAAGCPVIVKGHPAHPGTGELVASVIGEAIKKLALHPGTFSYLLSGGAREQEIGGALVRHPLVRAAGFTGSFGGGTALAKIASERPEPIPVFAEMGSVNPVFMLPRAIEQKAGVIAEKLYGSVTGSLGQQCTCPGLVFVVRANETEDFLRTLAQKFNDALPGVALSRRVRAAFVSRINQVMAVEGVAAYAGSPEPGHRDGDDDRPGPVRCSPVLLRTSFETFRDNPTLREECFGPSTLVVVCANEEEMIEAVSHVNGSLTGSVFAGKHDANALRPLVDALERRVGRLIFNGVPTGVEVCDAMVHGGPFPASNQPQTTAVGARAIRRWCRPVAYQNAPNVLLPPELREENPMGVFRTVDGEMAVPESRDPKK